MTTAAEIQQKYQCLRRSWDNYQAIYVGNPSQQLLLRADLVKRLTLLLDLGGDRLAAADRTWIVDNVYAQTDDRFPCQIGFTPPASACSDVQNRDNRLLGMCRDLTADNAVNLTDTEVFDRCVTQVVDQVSVGGAFRGLQRQLVNVAPGKTVAQSSTFSGARPERAIDGNRDGEWRGNSVSHTNSETNPYWKVDLGSSVQVETVNIWNRTDGCCRDRLNPGWLLVSDTPISADLATALQQPGIWTHHIVEASPSHLNIPVGRSGRYLQVQLEGASRPLHLAEVEVWARRPSDCAADNYRDAYLQMQKDLLQKHFNGLAPHLPDYVFPPDSLQDALVKLDTWYKLHRANTYPEGSPNPQLWNDLNQVLSGFLARVNLKAFVDGQGGLATAQVFNRGLSVNQQVLSAALTPWHTDTTITPLQRAPLVELLGETFKPVLDRVSNVASFHDLSCQFLDCRPGSFPTEVSDLADLLATLPSEAALTASVSAADQLRTGPHGDWHAIFRNIRDRHLILRLAVLDAIGAEYAAPPEWYDPAFLLKPIWYPLSPAAEMLTKIVQDALHKSKNYRATGRFDASLGHYLSIGMSQEHIGEITTNITQAINQLDSATALYTSDRDTYLRALIQQLQGQAALDNLKNKARIIATKWDTAGTELAQLRRYAAVEDLRYSNLAAAFTHQVDDALQRYHVNISQLDPMSISARNARFHCDGDQCARPDDIRNFTTTTQPFLRAKKGDLIQFSIGGSWSPTCALRNSWYTKACDPSSERCRNRTPLPPEGIDMGQLAGNPDTGPEGWTLTQQSSHWVATGHGTSESPSDPLSTVCGGMGAVAGILAFIPGGQVAAAVMGGAAAACSAVDGLTHGGGRSESSTHSDGQESRTAATFTSGLRAPDKTPLYVPAGSLLLLQMDQNETRTSQVVEMHVVQRNSNILVVPQDADLYLAVNDCDDQTSPASQRLTVQVQRWETTGRYIKALGRGMAIVYKQMRSDTDTFAEGGTVLPNDIAARRSAAISTLECLLSGDAACRERAGDQGDPDPVPPDQAIHVSQLPPEYSHLFETFVNKELARFERMVEMQNKARELRLLEIEAEGIKDGLDAQQLTVGYQQLLTAQALMNAEAQYTLGNVEFAMRRLLVKANRWLYPIMDIRCPASVSAFLTSDGQNLRDLARFDWASDLATQSTRAKTVVQHMLNQFTDNCPFPAETGNPNLVALTWPKPHSDGTISTEGQWAMVDRERANKVWADLLSTGYFELEVKPEDVYCLGCSRGFPLYCTESSPVIKTAALYTIWNGADVSWLQYWNEQHVLLGVQPDPNLQFVTEAGIKEYALERPDDWRNGINLITGKLQGDDRFTPLQAYRIYARGAHGGNGLTPFFRVVVNGNLNPGFGNPLREASELVLMFELETKTTTLVDLPPVCRDPSPI